MKKRTEILIYDIAKGNWEVNQIRFDLKHQYVNPIIILEGQSHVDIPNTYSLKQRLKLIFVFMLFKKIKLPIGLIFTRPEDYIHGKTK